MAFFYLSHTHEEHKSCTAWRCNSWTCSFVSCCLVFVATKLSKTPKLAFSYFFMFWLITTILSRRSVFSTLSHKILNIYFKETELEENSLKCNCLFTFWKVFNLQSFSQKKCELVDKHDKHKQRAHPTNSAKAPKIPRRNRGQHHQIRFNDDRPWDNFWTQVSWAYEKSKNLWMSCLINCILAMKCHLNIGDVDYKAAFKFGQFI